jgi:hypothetical protein
VTRTAERRMLNDTLHPLNIICYLNGDPYDWTGKTAAFVLEEDDGTDLTEAGTATAHPTQTFTADATTDRLTCVGHGVKLNDQVIVASTTTLPTGLSASTRYFAVSVTPNSFKVDLEPNGPGIDITGAGSGTHTFYIVGSVQIDFGAGDVDATGPFRLWVKSTSGSETTHFPDNEQGIPVSIERFGN